MTFISPEARIMEALTTHVKSLSWVKLVNWHKAKLAASDFRADECPVIQFVADAQTFYPERNDMICRWRVFMEIVLCSEVTGQVDQFELLEKMDSLFKHVGSYFRLGGNIPGVIQILPIGAVNELHLIEPFYIGVIEFEITYRKYYTAPC